MRGFRLLPRLSLRTLFSLITVATILLGWILYHARAQSYALHAIGAHEIYWNYQLPGGDFSKWNPDAAPSGPAWLQYIGESALFGRVRAINRVDPHIKQSIHVLASLPDLVILNLSGSDVDDQSLRWVAELSQLKSLNLAWTSITDDGLSLLGKLSDLQALWLDETKITDAGLVHLKSLSKLRRLYLEGTSVTDSAVKDLRDELPNCEIFWGRPSSPQWDPSSAPSR